MNRLAFLQPQGAETSGKVVVVQATVTFANIDLATLENDAEKKADFEERFRFSVARSAGVDPDFVVIVGITSGSVKVQYKVRGFHVVVNSLNI